MKQDTERVLFLFIWKKVHKINKTHVRARKICIFQLFILILQPFLHFYTVILL